MGLHLGLQASNRARKTPACTGAPTQFPSRAFQMGCYGEYQQAAWAENSATDDCSQFQLQD